MKSKPMKILAMVCERPLSALGLRTHCFLFSLLRQKSILFICRFRGCEFFFKSKGPKMDPFCPFLGLREGLLRARQGSLVAGVKYSWVLPLDTLMAPWEKVSSFLVAKKAPKTTQNGTFRGLNFSKLKRPQNVPNLTVKPL